MNCASNLASTHRLAHHDNVSKESGYCLCDDARLGAAACASPWLFAFLPPALWLIQSTLGSGGND